MDEVDFRSWFDRAPVALAVLSPDLTFAAVNRDYELLLGRTREQCVGRNLFDVFPGGSWKEGAETMRACFERLLAGDEDAADVVVLQRYDVEVPGFPGTSEERYWSVACRTLREAGGPVHGLVLRVEEVTSVVERIREEGRAPVFDEGLTRAAAIEAQLFFQTGRLQDVNQRLRSSEARERRIAEGLREMVRRQRQVVVDTSHDLRGPITGLQIRLAEALQDPDADPREILRAALQDAERLGDIIGELLELARLEAGAPAPTEPVDLAQLTRSELARRSFTITTSTSLGSGIVVDASPIRLARLLANLLANAERHAGSHLEVRLGATDGRAVLEVVDDGPGIPDADKERIFTRFFRRSDARSSDPGGSGLGLPIARQIAEAHGGTLHAADRTDGLPGARMVLRLPLRPSRPGLRDRGR
ncbi:PAS domain S-box-containing protein [Actinocorallia herbida]|uniref:histidine kinase n=1 Tax=Actinocorallia herbida TaxID=58109 RepID=A0A3N1D044_9ACTN|nr:PAS domain-containing sensor histidine kinase [Actinocorallia herbida]ROO86882.1 PAS domain S-box-containing protein [Actinocorallia herbida]